MLEWRDLHLSLNNGEKTQVILNKVSGYIAPGITALIGNSGCGKTSLLSLLADQTLKTPGLQAQGQIFVDHQEVTSTSSSVYKKYTNILAYMPQDPHIPPFLTVEEELEFTVRLSGLDDDPRILDQVLAEANLLESKEATVGNGLSIKGISGGQRKRLAFLTEIRPECRIALLDEPTSGLDAYQSLEVMQYLQKLCVDRQMAVLVSIHQPRTQICNLFTNVYLMVEGGRVAYFGPHSEMLAHFSSLGFECPSSSTPVDFVIEKVSLTGEDDSVAIIMEGAQTEYQVPHRWEDSYGHPVEPEALKKHRLPSCHFKSRYSASFLTQAQVLLSREFKGLWRDTSAWRTALATAYIFGGFTLWLIPTDPVYSQDSVFHRESLILLFAIQSYFRSVGDVFKLEATFPFFVRERQKNMYATLIYVISSLVNQVFFEFVVWIGPWTMNYFLYPFNHSFLRYATFIGILCLMNLVTKLVVMAAFIAAKGHPRGAMHFLIIYGVSQVLLAGYFVEDESLSFLQPVRYLGILNNGHYALMTNEFVDSFLTDCGAAKNKCVTTGDQILQQTGVTRSLTSYILNVGLIGLVMLGVTLLLYHTRLPTRLHVFASHEKGNWWSRLTRRSKKA